MATRFYLRNASGYAPKISPAYHSDWTNTASAARRMMEVTTDGADTLAFTGTQTWTAGQIMLSRQMVSQPLRAGQVISGTVAAYVRVLESNADDQAFTRLMIRVVSGDGATERAVLLANGHHGTSTEYSAVTTTSRAWANGDAIASYTTQAGDRIVVEIGHYDVTGTTPGASMHMGSSSGTDLDANESDVGGDNPWVEFSADIEFLIGGIESVVALGPDVQFYGEAETPTPAELAVDLSGNDTDFSVSGTDVQETSSTRCNLTSTGTWDMIVDANDTDATTLYDYNATNIRIGIVSGFAVRTIVNAATVLDVALSSASSVDRRIMISVAMEPNPLTTGASDARRYEVIAYQPEMGTIDRGVAFGAAPSGTTGTARFVTGGVAGFYAGRVSRAFHSTTEFWRSFVELSTATAAGETRLESVTAANGHSVAIHDDGQFAGPAYLTAAKALRTHDLRAWSPIVNEFWYGSWLEDSTWTMADPASASIDMHLESLRWRAIPPSCNRVNVRLFVQQNGASALDLIAYCYSGNWPGPVVKPDTSPDDFVHQRVSVTRNADDGTTDTVGAWVDLGLLEVARDNAGRSWFWLGFNPGTLTDYRVRAWTIDPVLADVQATQGGDIGGVSG